MKQPMISSIYWHLVIEAATTFSEAPYSAKLGIEDFVFDEEVEKEMLWKARNHGLEGFVLLYKICSVHQESTTLRFILKDTSIELAIAYEEWNRAFLMDAESLCTILKN